MSINQLKQLQKLKESWPLLTWNVFKPSGSQHDALVLLVMLILNNTKTAVEYGAHTGQLSALIALLLKEVDGKFTGIDDWRSAFYRCSIEKAQSIITSNLKFAELSNYELITADCNFPIYVDADFHYWDICSGRTTENLVSSLHSIINRYKDNGHFMICIDDAVRKHVHGNHEFLMHWQERFKELPEMHIPLITDNKIFLTNYKIDNNLLNSVIKILSSHRVLPHVSQDKFYEQTKYVGNFLEIDEWPAKLATEDLFWNELAELFKD